METQFKTANPSEFKLRLVWGIETGHKLVAEFSDCRWLPRQGELMILPMNEVRSDRNRIWQKFKVANIIYDFEHQVIRVVCAVLNSDFSLKETAFEQLGQEADKELQELKKKLNCL